MDISPSRFERMTWREFELRARGYFLRLARQKWMLREMIWHLLAVNGNDIERKDIMVLPWDEPDDFKRKKVLTPQELEHIKRKFTELQNQHIAKA